MSHHFMATRKGKSGSSSIFSFLGLQTHCRWWLQLWNSRCLLLRRKAMPNLDSVLKNRDITLPKKGLYSQSYGFSSSHVWMWELDSKEGWAKRIDAFKLWCWRRLLSPLDSKEIKPVNPKGNQFWIFIGRTDAEAEAPILGLLDVKCRLFGKDPDAGKDWRQEKRAAGNEMFGCYHWLNGHEFEQFPGDCEGQGSVVSCSPWGHKNSDTT